MTKQIVNKRGAEIRGICNICDYFSHPRTAGDKSECRFSPPCVFVSPETGEVKSAFPRVLYYEWCGSWKLATLKTDDTDELLHRLRAKQLFAAQRHDD